MAPRRRSAAFSLLEVAVAQMILGLSIAALCELFAAGGAATNGATELTQAINLANIPHDIALGLPFSPREGAEIGPFGEIWDLDGQAFAPPIDAEGTAIPSAQGWRQEVTVEAVDPERNLAPVEDRRRGRAARLTVAVYRHERLVYMGHWLIAKP